MSVRAKFRVTGISLEPYGGWQEVPKTVARRIKMSPVHSPEGENDAFGKATPQGNLEMLIVKPEAADEFELQGEYYVTFEKATPGMPVVVREAVVPGV